MIAVNNVHITGKETGNKSRWNPVS